MSRSALVLLLASLAAGALSLGTPRPLSSSPAPPESILDLSRVEKHGPDPLPKAVRDRRVQDLISTVQDRHRRSYVRTEAIMELGKLSTSESLSYLLDRLEETLDGHRPGFCGESTIHILPHLIALQCYAGGEVVGVILDEKINQARTERELREYRWFLDRKLGIKGTQGRIEKELKATQENGPRKKNLEILKRS